MGNGMYMQADWYGGASVIQPDQIPAAPAPAPDYTDLSVWNAYASTPKPGGALPNAGELVPGTNETIKDYAMRVHGYDPTDPGLLSYSSDNGSTFDNFMERAILGTLLAGGGSVISGAAGGGIVGGATAGGTIGGAGTALQGGSVEDILRAAATGAAVGGATGGLGELLSAPQVANSGMDFGPQGVGWDPNTITGATPALSTPSPVVQSLPVAEPPVLPQWALPPQPPVQVAAAPNVVTDVAPPMIAPPPEVYGNVAGGLSVAPEAASLESAIQGASTAGGASGITPGLATENAITGLGGGLTVPGVTSGGSLGALGAGSLGVGAGLLGAEALGAGGLAAGGTGAATVAGPATTAATAAGAGLGATKLGDLFKSEDPWSDLLGKTTLGDLGRITGTLGAAGLGAYASNEMGNKLSEISAAQRAADQSRYEDLTRREEARYADVKAREDAIRADLIRREQERLGTLQGREDAAISRQRGDIEFGRGVGAQSRDRYEASFSPTFDVNSLPGLRSALDTAYQGVLRGLSTQGNPYGNPGGLTEAQNYITGNVILPELNRYRTLNAGTGGYQQYAGSGATIPGINSSLPGSVSTTSNVSGGNSSAGGNIPTNGGLSASMQGVQADAGGYNALGFGLNNILNPPSSIEQLLKKMKGLT